MKRILLGTIALSLTVAGCAQGSSSSPSDSVAADSVAADSALSLPGACLAVAAKFNSTHAPAPFLDFAGMQSDFLAALLPIRGRAAAEAIPALDLLIDSQKKVAATSALGDAMDTQILGASIDAQIVFAKVCQDTGANITLSTRP